VARQGIDAARLQSLREALLAFGGQPDETALLTSLGAVRFVAVAGNAREERQEVLPGAAVPDQVAAVPSPERRESTSPPSLESKELPVTLVADQLD
jgi:hypothetical protein